MSGKLFYLDDRRFHNVLDPEFQEICTLPIEPGPSLVIAKGTVHGVGDGFNVAIGLRLEVHAIFSGLVGFDETELFSERPTSIGSGGVLVATGNPDRNTFALLVAATLPFEGGAGSGPPPPPHRAVLMARKETDGVGQLTNVKMAAYPFDEIVATVLETPRLPPVGPDDQHPK